MTENECIEILQYLLGYENAVDKGEIDTPNNINSQEKEALRMILEEVQAYRAIGTPTQIYEKIGGLDIELGKYHSIGTVDDYWKLNEMCKEYSAIGTIEEFKALKEKNEPKKIEKSGYIFKCPVCKAWVQSPQCFCHGCRQALDWQ